MHNTQGLADIEVSREENYPEINVVVDRKGGAPRHQRDGCRERRAVFIEWEWPVRTPSSLPTRKMGTNTTSAPGWRKNIAKTSQNPQTSY